MNEPKKTIVVKDLVTHYGEKMMLDRVSMEVLPGETMAVIGRSGCGKTTLLRHMVGLLKPTSGSIWILNKDIVRMKESEMVEILKRIGMLFQTSALFNSMTIYENVGLVLMGGPRDHVEQREGGSSRDARRAAGHAGSIRAQIYKRADAQQHALQCELALQPKQEPDISSFHRYFSPVAPNIRITRLLEKESPTGCFYGDEVLRTEERSDLDPALAYQVIEHAGEGSR